MTDSEKHGQDTEQKQKKVRLPRQPMPEQDPKVRARNFDEVNLGYSDELAQKESSRCLNCKKPKCVEGCPVGINIPGFIEKIKEGDPLGAARIIKESNMLPAVCGRVCPQENQCEGQCILGKKGESVAIGRLERYAADYEAAHGESSVPPAPEKTGKKVAIVGSGPAGLACAGDLAKMGHDVTVYEALHKAGGVLVYGIPQFRLPKEIVKREVDFLEKMGVNIRLNMVVGRIKTVDELMDRYGYDAVFIATGAGLPLFLNIPGENASGVYSANEYLTRANLMKAYRFPEYDTPIKKGKNVAVIGGGNVAMDSVRTALRIGAQNAYIVYRRSIDELPARKEEIEHAEHEGVQFKLLCNPIRIVTDDQGWVRALVCKKMELGEPDESGRRRPVPIEGSEFEMEVDTVIIAIGNSSNPLISSTTPDLKVNRWGNIIVDSEQSGKTSKKGVFAAGDIVTGAATVIKAMGAGRSVALAIDEYLRNSNGSSQELS